MFAFGRKQTLDFPIFGRSERLLLAKADIRGTGTNLPQSESQRETALPAKADMG